MKTMIASVNCYDRFLKTISKILQTFFSYILEAQQFTLAKVTLNQVLSTQVNSSRLDKVQNMPVEKILCAGFFSSELVNGVQTAKPGHFCAPNIYFLRPKIYKNSLIYFYGCLQCEVIQTFYIHCVNQQNVSKYEDGKQDTHHEQFSIETMIREHMRQ